MPRIDGVMQLLPGTYGEPDTTIKSVPYNAQLDDFVNDANSARPITAGGTDATTAAGARTNLLGVGATVDNTVPRFNGTAGAMQTSSVVIDDNNVVIAPATVSGTSATVQSYTGANQVQAFGTSTAGVLIHNSDTSGSGFLTFGDGAVAGRVGYNHSTNTMTLIANNVTVATLTGSLALQVNGQSDALAGINFEVKDSAGNSDFWVRGDGLTFALGSYNSTTATAANVAFSGSGALQRSTSAAKYKTDVQPVTKEALEKFKQLEGISYRSLCEGDDKDRRFTGIIADQAHALDLRDLVLYGKNGDVEGFAYERCTAYLIEWNKEIERKLEAMSK
jgi:hypothetical protein